jgi:hypothetical protein
MKFETVKGRWSSGELSQAEAGEILGVSERTFRRWYQRHEEEGLEGMNDRRLGKPSPKRVPVDCSDRGGHYFHTPESGGKVDKDKPTQVGRALAQLGIEHIAAYSPEARGRSERMFGTLQDRLPKELRLAGIADIDAANRFLAEVYLPAHNARFAVRSEQPGSAFVADRQRAFEDILCIQEDRVVGNDNTVRYRGLSLQLPESPLRSHFVRAKVRVHEYPDGSLAVFHGPRCLARYDDQGGLIDPVTSLAA